MKKSTNLALVGGDASPGWDFATHPAEPFRKLEFNATTVELLKLPTKIPTIYISEMALLKIYMIVGAIKLEVGWLGTAKLCENNFDIQVDDVFLFRQDVSLGHTELETESMSEIMQEVLGRPDGEEIFNNMKFWGHSHADGGTFPSHQDDVQMEGFRKFGAEFFLRGIFNRRSNINFSLYNWKDGIAYHHLPWEVNGDEMTDEGFLDMREKIHEEMMKKVTYTKPVYQTYYPPVPHRIFRNWRTPWKKRKH